MWFSSIVAAIPSLSMVALFSLSVGQAGADPKDDDNSRAALDAWLARIPGAEQGKVVPVSDEVIRRVFPDDRFYALRFMRYPRAQVVPRPLKLENLIEVTRDGSVKVLEKDLSFKKLLEEKLQLESVRDKAKARDALRASLLLAETYFQDGFYTFSIPEDSLSLTPEGDRLVASGKAVVTKGGRGEITVTLTFKASGKIDPDGAVVAGKVRADVRNL